VTRWWLLGFLPTGSFRTPCSTDGLGPPDEDARRVAGGGVGSVGRIVIVSGDMASLRTFFASSLQNQALPVNAVS
jgi:hypothetical protein